MIKKCKSCGDKFDTESKVDFNVERERMQWKIQYLMEEGSKCPQCIFDIAFEEEYHRESSRWAD